jgi:hypothetical protein
MHSPFGSSLQYERTGNSLADVKTARYSNAHCAFVQTNKVSFFIHAHVPFGASTHFKALAQSMQRFTNVFLFL